jgi:hypothetical protein
MIDIFQFPNIHGQTVEELAERTNNYLIQFKETLEFAINDIGIENLSAELVAKLNSLGANIEQSKKDKEDEYRQMSSRSGLCVSDVVSSNQFKASVEAETRKQVQNIRFSVNFETGELEYE